jgi:hypothetical protein
MKPTLLIIRNFQLSTLNFQLKKSVVSLSECEGNQTIVVLQLKNK